MNKLLPIALAAFLLAGCANTGNLSKDTAGTGSFGECNPLTSAGVGAGIGAIIGMATGGKSGGTLLGAGIGGALGALACAGWNEYQSTQAKTAQQVVADYQLANPKKALPEQAKLIKFDTKIQPSGKARSGDQVSASSYIEVLPGTNDSKPVIEEEMTLVKPDGTTLSARKKANANSTAGAYQTQFTFKLPEGVPQGVYPIKTTVFINGNKVASKDSSIQVVLNASKNALYAGL